ncbi:hypothetical protein SADUNF_Sadunf11G0034100 [Salix dunnii]|uniref:Uncharacterized protein n=1 Tax=Salix dunnii TaxID=1413687 RepID=A0A835MNV1_9ROSI|nr:hypothetical protein SADUNF_Sadunf11G0034100 [Salix dunnii]
MNGVGKAWLNVMEKDQTDKSFILSGVLEEAGSQQKRETITVSNFHTNSSLQQILKPKRFTDGALARQATTLLTITPTLMTSTLIKPISLAMANLSNGVLYFSSASAYPVMLQDCFALLFIAGAWAISGGNFEEWKECQHEVLEASLHKSL